MSSSSGTGRMRNTAVIRAGGLALIGGAVAFLAVFMFLAARFDYPDILDGAAADVLPMLLATGSAGRVAWAVYALLPLIWIPAGVGAFHALRPVREGSMRVAMLGEFLGELSFNLFFLLAALAMLRPGAGFPRWMGLAGVATAFAGLVGMFRNVTDVVDPVADVNNVLLPAWMIVFGVGLLQYAPPRPEQAVDS